MLLNEIDSTRVFSRMLLESLDEISTHEDAYGWIEPDNTKENQYTFERDYGEWVELVRAIAEKMRDSREYLMEKLGCGQKKAANPHADQSQGLTVNTAPENGCYNQHTTKSEKPQGVTE